MIWQPACVLKNIQDCGVQLPRLSMSRYRHVRTIVPGAFLVFLTGEPMSRKATESLSRSLLTFAVNFGSSLLVLGNISSGVWPSLGDNLRN